MSISEQPADPFSPGFAEPRRLDGSAYAKVEPAERAALNILAEEIEAERECQRIVLGKARDWPGGFPPAWMDQVDRLTWEKLLLRHPLGILDRCAKRGLKASDLLQMVSAHCAPSNPDAIFWMRERYCESEKLGRVVASVAIEATRALRRHLTAARVEGAAKAKRLHGDDIKDRVKLLAEPLRGTMSRQQAAGKIADKLGKGTPHILNLLREHYPGGYDSWPRPRSPGT